MEAFGEDVIFKRFFKDCRLFLVRCWGNPLWCRAHPLLLLQYQRLCHLLRQVHGANEDYRSQAPGIPDFFQTFQKKHIEKKYRKMTEILHFQIFSLLSTDLIWDLSCGACRIPVIGLVGDLGTSPPSDSEKDSSGRDHGES